MGIKLPKLVNIHKAVINKIILNKICTYMHRNYSSYYQFPQVAFISTAIEQHTYTHTPYIYDKAKIIQTVVRQYAHCITVFQKLWKLFLRNKFYTSE